MCIRDRLKVLLLTSELSCEASSIFTSTLFKGTDWKLLITNSKFSNLLKISSNWKYNSSKLEVKFFISFSISYIRKSIAERFFTKSLFVPFYWFGEFENTSLERSETSLCNLSNCWEIVRSLSLEKE